MVIEVAYAAVGAALYALGWCSKGHSCREHVSRQQRREKTPVAVTARRVRPELPAA